MNNEVEVAKYKITGLVDIFDEQMVITGQFPIGSIQELPVEYGMKCVEAGNAEAVGTEDVEEAEVAHTNTDASENNQESDSATSEDAGQTGEAASEDAIDNDATGETGEQEVE